MKKILLLSLFILFFVSCNSRKDYTIQLHLKDIQFDTLLFAGVNIRDNAVKIYGESTDGSNWNFSIPDSVYCSVLNPFLVPKLRGDGQNVKHRLIFLTCQNGDTLNYGGLFPLDRKIVKIYANYLNTQVRENAPMVNAGDNEIYFATYHSDYCVIPLYKNSEFEVQAYNPFFPNIPGCEQEAHENYIVQCLNIIKNSPDSRFLIGRVAENRTNFEKESLQRLYTAFSENNRQGYLGKIIDVYLKHFFIFSNMKLPEYNNGVLEYVIKDSTKTNLIVFSASWCIPCREEIPLLKKVYDDLKDQLEITYISMDEEKTADNWRKLMKDEAIPWRSLMAGKDIKVVQETYNPSKAIPFALLVYPNKTMEIIDIRKKDQKEKLYAVCNNSTK